MCKGQTEFGLRALLSNRVHKLAIAGLHFYNAKLRVEVVMPPLSASEQSRWRAVDPLCPGKFRDPIVLIEGAI